MTEDELKAISTFASSASESFLSEKAVLDVLVSLDGPSDELREVLISLDYKLRHTSSVIFKLVSSFGGDEALVLFRTLLEGQSKFLFLLLHPSGPEEALFEYSRVLPYDGLLRRKKAIQNAIEKFENGGVIERIGSVAADHEKSILLSKAAELKKEIREMEAHFEKCGRANIKDAREEIVRRWEPRSIFAETFLSNTLTYMSINEQYSFTSALIHYSAEGQVLIGRDMAVGKRIAANSADAKFLMSYCACSLLDRYYVLREISTSEPIYKDVIGMLKITRWLSDNGFGVSGVHMGPAKITNVEGKKISFEFVPLEELQDK